MLKLLALGSAGSLLAACAPATPAAPTAAPPPAPKPTAAPAPAAPAATTAPAAAPTAAPKPAATTAPAVTTAAKPTAAPAAPAGDQMYQQFLDGAKSEGRLVIAGPGPDVYGPTLKKFADVVPGITIDITHGGGGGTHYPKLKAERDGGQYLWDLYIGGAGSAFRSFKPAGILDPIKPHIVRSDVLDDSKWVSGFAFGWQDVEKQFTYAFEATLTRAIWVDRSKLPESELSTLDQLLDPKYDGKIGMHDPRVAGVGAGSFGHLYATKGKEWAEKLLRMNPIVYAEQAQTAEALARGTVSVAMGVAEGDVLKYQQEGLATNLDGLEMDGAGARMASLWGTINLVNRAPHPNAAKAFANWLLSKDGQTAWVEATALANSSRRIDTPEPQAIKSKPGMKWTDDEPNAATENDARALAAEILG